MIGISAAQDFNNYFPTFKYTMEGFSKLTDPAKINKKPERIRIKTIAKATNLQEVFRSYKMPTERYNELAILNGMQLKDVVPAGMMVKVVGL